MVKVPSMLVLKLVAMVPKVQFCPLHSVCIFESVQCDNLRAAKVRWACIQLRVWLTHLWALN